MADWAGLLPDLLVQIAKRIPLVEDLMAFRGVCTSWRAPATHDLLDSVFNSWPVVPLLMLAESENNPDREFYSIAKGKVSMILSLPELQGKKCMESRFGWFLTVGSKEELELFHPFTRRRIELPPQDSFPDYNMYGCRTPFLYIELSVLSANPSHTSDFVLMVIHAGGMFLGFWRSGDTSWTMIKRDTSLTRIKSRGVAFSDINYYNGKFYAIDIKCGIWVWDVSATDDLTVAKRLFGLDIALVGVKAYLVESSGELLVVLRDGVALDADYGVTYFRVIQLDLIAKRWSVVTNIGDWSIFLGHNAAFSLDVTGFKGAIKANCIYFADDCIQAYGAGKKYNPTKLGGGKDMGVYNLGDGKIERFDNVESYSFIGPPVWVAPCY